MDADRNSIFELRDVSLWYGTTPVLSNVNLPISERRITSIIGSSGSGKTTFLRSLNRLHDLSPAFRMSGSIRFRGRDVYPNGTRAPDPSRLRKEVGMVFQRPCVFPTTIYNNVLFGIRRLALRSRREFPSIVEETLKSAALWEEVSDRLHRPAHELSQGQQQRLAIARALACEPSVLLLDEPTASLDPKSAEAIEALLKRIKTDLTIVLVTHQLEQARRLSDEVIFLNNGRICEWGPAERVLMSPREEATRCFLSLVGAPDSRA